ncbi:hypothetical protein M3152_02445 [Sporosarcina luteola]|uniref:hypothetical protein n=1 Tax=Sporosarcina luteola TaxID=582850 RepID=UPI00203B6E51|nr:hypothetical protein [Sporosarcina luteola]MCM3636565.1 hypothetical protein [Sporosarcina luteola]
MPKGGNSPTLNKYMKQSFLRVWKTLNPNNLYYVGTYEFVVTKKANVKLHRQYNGAYSLFVSEKDGKYNDTLVVNLSTFKKNAVGSTIKCGVVKHRGNDEFAVVTRETEGYKAIKSIVSGSRIKLMFLLLILAFIILQLGFFFTFFLSLTL